MDEILRWATPLIAVVASIAGVLATLDQLTLGSRLRRKAALWKDRLEESESDYEKAVLRSLQRENTARLIAREGYPAGKSILPLAGAFSLLYLCAYSGYFWATSSSAGSTLASWVPFAAAAFIILLYMPYNVARLADVVVRRRLVILQYLYGQKISTPDDELQHLTRKLVDGGGGLFRTRLYWKLAVFSLGLGFESAAGGVIVAGSRELPDVFIAAAFILVPLIILFSWFSVRDIFDEGVIRWEHPREFEYDIKEEISRFQQALYDIRRLLFRSPTNPSGKTGDSTTPT